VNRILWMAGLPRLIDERCCLSANGFWLEEWDICPRLPAVLGENCIRSAAEKRDELGPVSRISPDRRNLPSWRPAWELAEKVGVSGKTLGKAFLRG
jgi:hypothetical protein